MNRAASDPLTWRELMALPDAALLQVLEDARAAYETAQEQRSGLREAGSWVSLIEGATATRFGVGRHLDRDRNR